jgi:hypothetical protein
MIVAVVDWTNVLLALIAGLPAIIAALAAISVHRQIKTPSGTSIGKQVEGTHHVSLGNNYRLRAVTGELGASAPAQAVRQEAQVEDLDGEEMSG